jgi:Zn-finger nucleic acid-binding protein
MPKSLICPSCKRNLREVDHRGVHIDACDCGGMWFDRGEIETWTRGRDIASRAKLSVGAREQSSAVRCPRCECDSMHGHVVDGVAFSGCKRCGGVWLTPEGVAKIDPARGCGDEPSWLEDLLWFAWIWP